MTSATKTYRQVPVGTTSPDAVTVGIERSADGRRVAAVWWESKGDVDPDERSYDRVDDALEAAEAARALHSFQEVVIVVTTPELWQTEWGTLEEIESQRT